MTAKNDTFIFGGTPASKTSLINWVHAAASCPSLNIHLFERPGFGDALPEARSFKSWRKSVDAYVQQHEIDSI
jgi:hypothetical protein